MEPQIPLDPAARAENTQQDEIRDDGTHEVAPDLAYKRLVIANIVFFGPSGAGNKGWVLIDAGVAGTTGMIVSAVEKRFGEGARPAAIILTHGHFDHVGALEDLARMWNVPIYAHELELPYLNGSAAYPPPDPSVGGGMMSMLPRFNPRGPVDVSQWLQVLPPDGIVPEMPGWKWIHAPGHTAGQITLWREEDRTIIAADAFITTRQESAYAVAAQTPEMHGPPAYYTQNWEQARDSVQRLAALGPDLAITGHGPAMRGPEMRLALEVLARDFDSIAVPEQGQYVEDPATAETGTAYAAAGK